MLDPVSGQWVDDEFDPAKPNGGDVGAQTDAPVIPSPPPPGGPMHYVQDEPTVITANDPGTDVLPQPAAGLPQPAPYVPQAMPPIPPGRVVSPAESQNLGAIDANTAARMASAQDAGALGDAGAQAKLQAANRDAYATQGLDADKARTADEFAKRVAAREQQAQADYQQYKSFGIKDPQADDSFATRILKAIVIGMGQYAAGMTGGQNTALHIIQSANEQNIARQKAQQEKLLAVAERSGKDVEATKKERDDAFRQLDLKHAAMLESSAGMLRQELARIGVPQAQIDSNEAVQKVEQDALSIRERTLQGIRDDETSLARADIAAKARADAARMRKGKGGEGGGGAMDARAQLAEYAQAHPGDDPGLIRLAAKLNLGRKDIAAAQKQEKDQTTAARGQEDKFASENGINAIAKQQRELSELSKALKDNKGNPLQQALAVEKAVSAARGGAASKQALALALGHLGGTLDGAEAVIQKIKDGQLGPKQLANFEAFLNGQHGASQAAGKEAYDSYMKMVEDAPDVGTKARLLRDRPRLFSGMEGYGKPDGAPAGGGGAPAPDAKRAAAQRVANDPKVDPATRARALLYLKQEQ